MRDASIALRHPSLISRRHIRRHRRERASILLLSNSPDTISSGQRNAKLLHALNNGNYFILFCYFDEDYDFQGEEKNLAFFFISSRKMDEERKRVFPVSIELRFIRCPGRALDELFDSKTFHEKHTLTT